MRVKFMGATPIRYGDVSVSLGDVLDLPKREAEQVLSSSLWAPVKEEPKARSKKKPTPKTEEES